jgi:hypothetical protein
VAWHACNQEKHLIDSGYRAKQVLLSSLKFT